MNDKVTDMPEKIEAACMLCGGQLVYGKRDKFTIRCLSCKSVWIGGDLMDTKFAAGVLNTHGED